MVYKIAEAFLTFGPMKHEKIQKLCYFSYAWYLTFFGEKLFNHRFYAADDGPVCPELYEKYVFYDNRYIPKLEKKLACIIPDLELREFIEVVYDAHGFLKTEELTDLACSEEPWIFSRQRLALGEDNVYNDDEIINWHTKKVLRELTKENSFFA